MGVAVSVLVTVDLFVDPARQDELLQVLAGAFPDTRSYDGCEEITAFVDQDQLFDYYNFGRYSPVAIRAAVRAIQPRYLLLLGRTSGSSPSRAGPYRGS